MSDPAEIAPDDRDVNEESAEDPIEDDSVDKA
jgi:hypothetical protein